MWARQLASKKFSQTNNVNNAKTNFCAPKSIVFSKNFSTVRSSYYTFKGKNYASFNNVSQQPKFKFQQKRLYSKPTEATEPEPVVVHVKDDTKTETDILTRTTWITSFSGFLIALGVAVGLAFDVLGNSSPEERNANLENSDEIVEGLQFLRLLPLKWMAGQMADQAQKELTPDEMQKKVERYASLYNIDFIGLEKENVRDYKTFEEFFTRKYKPEKIAASFSAQGRYENDAIYSPAEGTVMSIEKINSDLHKAYIKDEWYSAKQFLGFNPFEEAENIQAERIQTIEEALGTKVTQKPNPDMYMCVIYLGPGNYHRFHSPTSWVAKKRIYYSGNYYPVRPSYLNFFNYKSLLATNERVVLSGEGKHGFFSMIPVGATNVGSIHLTHEPEFDNVALQADREEKKYDTPFRFPISEEIGYFSLGSTVVLVFEFLDGAVNVIPQQKVPLGFPLVVKRKAYENAYDLQGNYKKNYDVEEARKYDVQL